MQWGHEVARAEQVDSGHGRVEHRLLESTERLSDYLDWPGVKQVCRIRRRRTVKGKTSEETVYAITSLGREQADAAALLKLSRGHWGIENRLHCVRDMTFQEDRCRVRTGVLPQVLAAVRNTAITLLRKLGHDNIVEGREHFAEHRRQAVRLIRYGRIK